MYEMKKIKCGIFHIDEKISQRFSKFIEQTPFLTLSVKHTLPTEMLSACHQKKVELLFCGIDDDMKGIRSFCSLLDTSIFIVFISSDKSRAFDSFRLNALDFLLPTDSYQVFLTSANKALQRLSLKTPEAQSTHIFIKSEYRIIRLEFDNIDYIESCNDYVKIHCNNQEKSILSLCSLKKLGSVLPASDFIRVHRSYIVRKQSIKVLENRSILFNKVRIPVSKTNFKLLQDFIHVCE